MFPACFKMFPACFIFTFSNIKSQNTKEKGKDLAQSYDTGPPVSL